MKKGSILEFQVSDLAFGGKGIAKFEGFVIFIDGALPGQKVKGKIMKKKKKYAEAKLLEILERSDLEIDHGYRDFPGAPWARLPVSKQIEYKRQQVFDCFKKFGKIDLGSVLDEVISSPESWNYRNKMEFSFGVSEESCLMNVVGGKKIWKHSGFALGSKKRGQYWLVENLKNPSGLFDEDFESFLPKIRLFCEQTLLPVYNQKIGEGFFRYLVVRKSFFENKFLVNLITTLEEADSFPVKDFISLLLRQFEGRINGIFWSINDNIGDTTQNYVKRDLVYGEEKLIEKINGLTFEISLNSFFQTNPLAAEKLYGKVIEYADLNAGDRGLDLCCGTGTIAQLLAKNFPDSKIVGVDIVESAINDARENVKRNKLENVEFYCDDVRKFLKSLTHDLNRGLTIKTIVLDPPRSGLAPKALQRILELKPETIVYISCNPATMARDAAIMKEGGYEAKKISIVNQFPHTSHVECIGKFKRFSNEMAAIFLCFLKIVEIHFLLH